MNRDFELEFKELKLNEVPDLWNRIEAGLSEKKIVAPVSENMAVSNVYKFGKKPRWIRWGTIAAACLCVAVILPALSFVIGSLGGRKDYTASGADGSTDNFATAAADNGGADGTAGDVDLAEEINNADNAIQANEYNMASEDNMTGASKTTSMSEMAGAEMEESADSADRAVNKQEAASADTASDSLSDEQKQMNGISEDNAWILNGVVVEISQGSVSGKDIIYNAVVKQPDKEGFLSEGLEITIVCNSDTDYGFAVAPRTKKALKANESYEVTLKLDKNNQKDNEAGKSVDIVESDRFVVISAERNDNK